MTIDINAWSWPQWTALILTFIGLAFHASLNGKPKVDGDGHPYKWNFPVKVVNTLIWGFILVGGGFFR